MFAWAMLSAIWRTARVLLRWFRSKGTEVSKTNEASAPGPGRNTWAVSLGVAATTFIGFLAFVPTLQPSADSSTRARADVICLVTTLSQGVSATRYTKYVCRIDAAVKHAPIGRDGIAGLGGAAAAVLAASICLAGFINPGSRRLKRLHRVSAALIAVAWLLALVVLFGHAISPAGYVAPIHIDMQWILSGLGDLMSLLAVAAARTPVAWVGSVAAVFLIVRVLIYSRGRMGPPPLAA